jgi:trafficking protein particle complex subunit 13
MRLTRPTLVSPRIITSEPTDLPQNTLNAVLKRETPAIFNGTETIGSGQFMLLPQSFGNIYLGETFSSYICVHNCTTHPVNSVAVKADLQSNSTRISLPIHANKQLPITLNPEETLDDVIHHEVKEIGTHILVCEVQYITPAGFQKSFRKFFKFQVVKPLDVKTKFYNAETDEVYLEAQVSIG